MLRFNLPKFPSGNIKPHYHDERAECVKIISGNGLVRVNDKSVTSSPDDIVLIQPGEIHEFINLSDSENFIFLVIRTNDPGNEDMIFSDK